MSAVELLTNAQFASLLGTGRRSVPVIDIITGIEFNLCFSGARTDHYDVTPATPEDMEKMQIANGGSLNWVARPVALKINNRMIAGGLNTFMHHIRIGGGNPGENFPSRNENGPPWTRWGGHCCLYLSDSTGGAGDIDSLNRHARPEANRLANTPKARGRQARAACHEAFFLGNEKLNPAVLPKSVQPAFSDVSASSIAFNAIDWANNKGLVTGSNGKFLPDDGMTRAQFALLLYRYEGCPPVKANGRFADVHSSSVALSAISWVDETRIATGSGDRFLPDDKITRAQTVLMLFRYNALKKRVLTAKSSVLNFFPDREMIPEAATDAMRWAVTHGLITGNTGLLLPNEAITRAQSVLVLFRYHHSGITIPVSQTQAPQ